MWLEGDLEMMKRCDAVLMVPGWEKSQGAMIEYKVAINRGLPVFCSLVDLRAFVS